MNQLQIELSTALREISRLLRVLSPCCRLKRSLKLPISYDICGQASKLIPLLTMFTQPFSTVSACRRFQHGEGPSLLLLGPSHVTVIFRELPLTALLQIFVVGTQPRNLV